MSESELTQYIMSDENGLIKVREALGYRIEVVYSPADLVMVRDLREVETIEERNEYLMAYDTISYFLLRLSHQGREVESQFSSNPGLFTSVIEYLGDGISGDLNVITETDTIPAIAVSYVRAFGTAERTTVLCAFGDNLRNKHGDVRFVFNDSKLDTGNHEFVFSAQKIKSIPRVKF